MVKTIILFQNTHLFMRSGYPTPEPHKHLAVHLLFAEQGELRCRIKGESICAKGICIASDVEHTACAAEGNVLVYLFDETSSYAVGLKKDFLKGRDYTLLEEGLVQKILDCWKLAGKTPEVFDGMALTILGMTEETSGIYDERVEAMLKEIGEMETITPEALTILERKLCLSKSRLSHLFKENVGIAPVRYLVLEKMRKCYKYYMETGNITQSCMKAGFDSPSHFAAVCKRMFGISFSEFAKSTK